MGIFQKCEGYVEARDAERRGVYPYYLPIERAEPTRIRVEGRWKIMLGSNNYLGLTHHPRVLEAAEEALARYGSGATGSRLLNGNLDLHDELEARLARFLGKEAAVVFTTGYLANLGTLEALAGRGDHLFLDRLNHASLIDGARLAFGEVHRYPHGDLNALDRLLEETAGASGRMVVTDGVFSMDGDVVDLPALCRIARGHGAAVMVDDAHGLGVLGPTGAGTAERFGVTDQVDLIMATFSKSLGSVGGVVAGPERVVHYLRHRARALLFSAGMPPASVAGVLAALDVLREEPERRRRLMENARTLSDALRSEGFRAAPAETPILPVHVGGRERVLRFWRALYDRDVYVNAVVPPGVPEREARLRISVTALHDASHLARAVEAFRDVERVLAPAG